LLKLVKAWIDQSTLANRSKGGYTIK